MWGDWVASVVNSRGGGLLYSAGAVVYAAARLGEVCADDGDVAQLAARSRCFAVQMNMQVRQG